jgi:hypothetical protein
VAGGLRADELGSQLQRRRPRGTTTCLSGPGRTLRRTGDGRFLSWK